MNYSFKTDVGKVRKTNEDSIYVSKNKYGDLIAIVADGMGGHNAGDIASKVTVSKIGKKWSITDSIKNVASAKRWLSNEIKNVNQHILTHSQNEQILSGMGTTVVIAMVLEDCTIIANVGDSRAYALINRDLIQVTHDHTLVNELLENGKITKEEALVHPQKNVLMQAVGTSKVLKIDFFELTNNYGSLLLCSDGLTNTVSNEKITDIMVNNTTEVAVNKLIEEANRNGGYDNISVAILKAGDL